ncbi:MAG: Gfo/Idh/MocA family oxidoreductase, partial [Phycisphaerales bacterium]
MSARDLRIGLVGYGFMGRAHANAIRQVPHFFPGTRKPVLQAVCGRDAAKVGAFAEAWDAASVETDWRRLVERD